MVQAVRSGSPGEGGALGALARQLADALRTSRLTIVVGAAGAGKSAVLARVLPLLRRRASDLSPAASAAPGVVVPFPDRRSRAPGGAQHEWIHTMEHWDDASLQALQRTLGDDASGRGRRPIAEVMAPSTLAAHAEHHAGARLLFVFDHFEELLSAARTRVGHRRLIETWATSVRSPLLQAHFLVAVDERSWPWLHAVCVGLPNDLWNALRLRPQGSASVLEPVIRPLQMAPPLVRTPLGIVPLPGRAPSSAQFLDSVNDGVRRIAKSARDQHARGGHGFGASLPQFAGNLGPRGVAAPGAPERTVDGTAHRTDDRAVDPAAQRIADVHAAEAERRERVPPAEVAAPVHPPDAARPDPVPPPEEAAPAHAAQAERPEPVAPPEVAAPAAAAPSPCMPPPMPAVREAAPSTALAAPGETAGNSASDEATVPAQATPVQATPAPRRRPMRALPAVAVLVIGAGLAWWWHATSTAPPAAADTPVVAAPPAAAPIATTPTPAATAATAASPAPTPAAAARDSADPAPTAPAPQPASPAANAAPPAAGPAFAALGVSTGGAHARVARELLAALPADAAPTRIEPLARTTDPVAWLQRAPGRLGIARLDALRAAPSGGRAVPLLVLTPLFAEPVVFIVRADSPLRYVRELRGQRISVGPAHSDAAHTVREVLRRLTGVSPAQTAALAPDAAVAELVGFQSIDAMALVDAQPLAWWATLDPATARRLRVLTLDPEHPQDRRYLQSVGTEPLRVAVPGGGPGAAATVPAVMSYLVASGDADPGTDRLTAMAQALCRELPRLRQQGHPAWRDVRPRAQTDTGWPVAGAFRSTVSRCVR